MNPESNRLEYKRQLTSSLEKEVIAFLNYRDGGIIYLGIDDKTGKPIGIENPDKIQLQVKDRIKNNITPQAMGLFDVITEKQDGKSIIKIIVASGPEKPYYLTKMGMSSKGCFLRVGSATEPMPTTMIENLFSRRIRNGIGNIRSRYQDLTFEQLKIYYDETPHRLNDKFARNLELLNEDGDYNYAAYLLSDNNGCSIKVAKYSGTNRVNLIENEEYGYCSLVKATKAVLDKLHIENRTFAKITDTTRLERKQIDSEALREAVINAIVHNNYTTEISPKFELFQDRLEITSAGRIPEGFTKEEFFMGYSVPPNKILMRIYKDLEMVEHLGSGIPRILEKYDPSIYNFTANFIRVVIPFAEGYEESTPQVTPQVTPQATPQANDQAEKVLQFCIEPHNRDEIQSFLGLKDREYFRKEILKPLIEIGKLKLTIPDKPTSPNQKYVTMKVWDKEKLNEQ